MRKIEICGVVLVTLFIVACTQFDHAFLDRYARGATKAQVIADFGKPDEIHRVNGWEQFIYQGKRNFSACFDSYGLLYELVKGNVCSHYK